MANQALKQYGVKKTPQSQPIPGQAQVRNSAGGFVYEADIWSRLNRWLILGSEGGTYYASEQDATFENIDCLAECVAEDGARTVNVIVAISKEGRAPKNDSALFALAFCAANGDDKTRSLAYSALPEVARIGTHLFQFLAFSEQLREGWGRGLRNAVARWYTQMDPQRLALQVIKYRQREGWTHRDALRKAHPAANGHEHPETAHLLSWIARKENRFLGEQENPVWSLIRGFEKVQEASDSTEAAHLVSKYGLPREAVPTELLNSPEVYSALLPHMPIGALVRNLATMTRIGLLTNTSEATSLVLNKLANQEAISKSRIHPIQVLSALMTYKSGQSVRGSATWVPAPRIVDALDEAFYASFGNVPSTGLRRLIALDISGSMWGRAWGGAGWVAGVPGLDPARAAAAMAMVSIHTGDPYEVVCFTSDGWGRSHIPNKLMNGLSGLALSKRQRLDDVIKAMGEMSHYMGRTDCALPMVWAQRAEREFDVFEVYTDNETWHGDIHPSQAVKSYRKSSGIDAKLIVVGMVANKFSIADPKDPGMMDVVGFDTATPSIMSAFANNEL